MAKTVPADGVRFLADCMLGRLCKWLRIIGYDAEYCPAQGRDTGAIAARALAEGRIVLTRDTVFGKMPKGPRCCILREQHWRKQLFRVKKELNLEFRESALFSRCLLCNRPLAEVAADHITPEEIPPAVRESNTRYYFCSACNRHFWRGGHVTVTIEALRDLQGGTHK